MIKRRAAEKDISVIRRAVAAAAMGNATEWYDFSVVTMLSALYYPRNYWVSFIVLALGFVMRTPGGIYLGPLGDKIGRQKILIATVLMMSGGTVTMGLLPKFDGRYQSGALALAILLRMAQGFFTGGEYVGAATFMAEYAPTRKRGFYGSFLEVGTLTGYIIGILVVLAVSVGPMKPFFHDWGWRIPFLLAAPFGLTGLFLRLKLQDTPTFRAALSSSGKAERPPVRAIITGHWRMIVNLIGIVMLLNIADYLLLTTMPGYFSTTLGANGTASMLILVLVETIMLVTLPFLGMLSDRVGRKPLLITSTVGYIVLSYPSFRLMETHTFAGLIVGFLVMGLLLALLLAVIASTFPAMFPTRTRYGAMAIGYNVSTTIFGSITSPVVKYLPHATGLTSLPAFYLMLAAAVALIPVLLIPETKGVPMDKIKSYNFLSFPNKLAYADTDAD